MARAALDYGRLADYYDEYCRFEADVDFFASLASGASGNILELMAGTGRLSVPLVSRGIPLTCIDSSVPMLAKLRGKLVERRLRAATVCADVRRLPFREQFSLVLLPFQGLTELAQPQDQLAMFRAVADCLKPGGRFVCTSHNPVVRLRSVDDTWHEVGQFIRSGGGTILVALRTRFDGETLNVVGQQRLVVTDASGSTSVLTTELRFALPSLADVTTLAHAVGLHVVSVLGDYGGRPFDDTSSPALIVLLEKPA